MRPLQRLHNVSIARSPCMPVTEAARRPRPRSVQSHAALGSALMGVAKTAATSAAITAAFGGLLEAFAPQGKPDVKRVAGAMTFGGGVGGGAALGVTLPHALAAVTGIPLGVVISSSLIGAWAVLRSRQK